MRQDLKTMLEALVIVAWADGTIHAQEAVVLDALVDAFGLSAEEAAWIRQFARTPRTLDDLQLAQLDHDQRRALLQHAITLVHADGVQADSELATLRALALRLAVPPAESEAIIAAAARRAKRLPALR